MRSFRLPSALTGALLATTMVTAPALSIAQGVADGDIRPNSWYWGMYGGQTSFATTIARTVAPMMGVEWTITRSKFALNVFAEESYFNARSTVNDPDTLALLQVDIHGMRRVGGSAMMFLPQYKHFHSWFGAGYAFTIIREATPQGIAGPEDYAVVDSSRAQGKLFGEFGVMVAYRQWAPFLQYTVMPTKGTSSWMVNGDGSTNIWKLGFRYNFGNAIEERW